MPNAVRHRLPLRSEKSVHHPSSIYRHISRFVAVVPVTSVPEKSSNLHPYFTPVLHAIAPGLGLSLSQSASFCCSCPEVRGLVLALFSFRYHPNAGLPWCERCVSTSGALPDRWHRIRAGGCPRSASRLPKRHGFVVDLRIWGGGQSSRRTCGRTERARRRIDCVNDLGVQLRQCAPRTVKNGSSSIARASRSYSSKLLRIPAWAIKTRSSR